MVSFQTNTLFLIRPFHFNKYKWSLWFFNLDHETFSQRSQIFIFIRAKLMFALICNPTNCLTWESFLTRMDRHCGWITINRYLMEKKNNSSDYALRHSIIFLPSASIILSEEWLQNFYHIWFINNEIKKVVKVLFKK